MVPLLVLACTPAERPHGAGPPPPSTEGVVDTAAPDPTDTSASTGDTAGTLGAPECEDLPTGPVPFTVLDISTTEDFDFDALGKLFYSDQWNFVAVDTALQLEVVAPGIYDTRGIQVLEGGDIVAAYHSNGFVGYTERATGASYPLIGGLQDPNALEVADDGEIFVSQTYYRDPRVWSFDLATLTPTPIADGLAYPNGLALNDTQDVLYIADGEWGVWQVQQQADGTWADKVRLFDPPDGDSYDAIEVDVCGNVYTVHFNTGELYRFDPDTLENELIAELYEPGTLYNSMRWGSDRGGWRRDVLYVTNRRHVFAVEVGVRGRRQPVDALP